MGLPSGTSGRGIRMACNKIRGGKPIIHDFWYQDLSRNFFASRTGPKPRLTFQSLIFMYSLSDSSGSTPGPRMYVFVMKAYFLAQSSWPWSVPNSMLWPRAARILAISMMGALFMSGTNFRRKQIIRTSICFTTSRNDYQKAPSWWCPLCSKKFIRSCVCREVYGVGLRYFDSIHGR